MNEISIAHSGDSDVAYRLIGDPRGIDVVVVAGAFFRSRCSRLPA